MAQLEAAARKQGFSSLAEVDQCILEPGGTLSFIAKKPDVDDTRHRELLSNFEKLREEIAILRSSRPRMRTPADAAGSVNQKAAYGRTQADQAKHNAGKPENSLLG